MMCVPPRANLLILTGVDFAELFGVRRIAQKTRESAVVTAAATAAAEPSADLDEIPPEFTSPDTWPKTTRLRCWRCTMVPVDYPRFIAKNVVNNGAVAVYTTFGVFDSWPCAAGYIEDNFTGDAKWNYHHMLCMVEAVFTGGPLKTYIPRAPPMTVLREFRGRYGLTQQQFRDRVNEMYYST